MTESDSPVVQPLASPCVNVCVLQGDHCIGCFRTLDEIGRWGAMVETERRAVVAQLPARIDKIFD
jgi:uncharacterized protein